MKQALPISLAIAILVVDYISLLMMICVAIGLYRAAKREAFHIMQYSAGFQIICVVLLVVYDILSKHELISKNWQAGELYFDQPNVAITTTVWIQVAAASLFHLICVPIYLAGLLQVLALDYILSTKNTWLKRFLFVRPFVFFSSGIIPGIVLCGIYWCEVKLTNIQGYTTAGYIILPAINSYTLWFTFGASIIITFYAGYRSIRTGRRIQEIQKKSKLINQQIVPKVFVSQALMIGIALPAVGLIKASEYLIWVFPSVINVYLCVFGIIFQISTPILTFISCGSTTNIYPLVPIFSPILKFLNSKLAVDDMEFGTQRDKASTLFSANNEPSRIN